MPRRVIFGGSAGRHVMHRTLIIGTLVAAMLLAAPASQASGWEDIFDGSVEAIRIEVGPDAMLFHIDGLQVAGGSAQQLRSHLDNMPGVGNGDGVVTENERRSFEATMFMALNAALPSEFDISIATIDGKTPFRADELPVVQMRALEVTGAEGAVTSNAPIRASLTILLYFESVQQGVAAHTVRFENIWGDVGFEADDAPAIEIHLSGYGSWTVDRSTVSPATLRDRMDGDTFVFTNDDLRYFSQEGSGVEFVVRGDPDDRILSESPVGAVFLIALLGMLGLALRRRP
jgi:hypothetical protein